MTKIAHSALGVVSYEAKKSEKQNLQFRRSLYVVEDIKAGEPFSNENVRSVRPGNGLPPKMLPDILGKKASRSIAKNTPLSLDLLSN